MFLVSDEYLTTTHGKLGCIACHGGENLPTQSEAHAGMNPYPSADVNGVCSTCHSEITATFASSTHYNIQGMSNGLMEYTDFTTLSESPAHQEAFDKNCYKCHASCGDCHVSRPKAYSTGLIEEHTFFQQPPMDETCYGCHNMRNAGEYMGKVGFGSDVHFDNGMVCADCHGWSNFHGTGELVYNMWEEDLPSCLDCHGDKDPAVATDTNHKVHGDSLSCQVCHAQANNNCFECHLEYNEDKTKLAGLSETKLMFRVGLNTDITEERPYKYVALRHIPSSADMIASVGEGLMPKYDDKINWKYSPTHNIQKSTFQNESCEACHDSTKVFLQPSDLRETDSKANEAVIPALPPKLDY